MTASTDKPQYHLGERPKFAIVVNNAGIAVCVTDLNRSLRDLVVSTAGKPVWSSADCAGVVFGAQHPPPELHTLKPGQQVSYGLTWAGRTSAPGCSTDRHAVPAGTYEVTGKIGSAVTSPAVTFKFIK